MRLLICTQAVDLDDPVLGFFHRWIEEFAKHAEKITVICLRKGDYDLPGVEVIALGEHAKLSRALELCSIAFGRRGDYDAVFVHMNPEYLVAAGWLWRLLRKTTALWYVHRAVPWQLRAGFPFADVVFTVAKETFGIASSKVVALGHGIDVADGGPRHEPHERRVIVAVGRISRVKRFDEIVAGLSALRADGGQFEFRIIGGPVTADDIVYERELREAVAALPWHDDVVFAGFVPHAAIPQVLAQADVLLSMTPAGSFDKSVLEALNWGALVVTANPAFADAPGVQVVDPSDADGIARAVQRPAAPVDETRAYLRKQHDLATLIARMAETLGAREGK